MSKETDTTLLSAGQARLGAAQPSRWTLQPFRAHLRLRCSIRPLKTFTVPIAGKGSKTMLVKTGQIFRYRYPALKAPRQGTSTYRLLPIRTTCSRRHPSNTTARQLTCSRYSSLTQSETAVVRPAKTKFTLPLAQFRPRSSSQFKCSKGSILR